jgi:lipid-A-disaccharide synthase
MRKLQSIKPDYQFLISKSNTVSNDLFNHCLKNQQNVHIIDGYNYEMMKYSDFIIVKSGTTTLEAASIGTPLAIVYKVNKLSYHIAKKLIRVKYIGLPNIIFDAPVLPELIQDDFNADKIIDTILDFMSDSEKYNQVSAKLSTINSLLGQQSASDAVAELMIKFVATPPL